eukprot:gene1338-1460_t
MELSVEQFVNQLLADQYNISISHFRSSSTLRDIFNEIILSVTQQGFIQSWELCCMKARLAALLKLTVDQLCIPTYMTALGVGSESILSAFTSSHGNFASLMLIDKLKVLLHEIVLFFVKSESCLFLEGSDGELDPYRAELFLKLMKLKCSPLYSQSIVMKEYGPRALEALSCHILGVTAVTAEIQAEVQNASVYLINALHREETGITMGIEVDNPHLNHILREYFLWLRESASTLTKACRREEILAAVNPAVRTSLKEENYRSPLHLVTLYRSKYAALLRDLSIPLQPYCKKDLKQAHKDILREDIRVNKVLYIGGRTPTGSLQSGQDLQLDADYVNKYEISSIEDKFEELDATEAISEELKKVIVFLANLSDPSVLQSCSSYWEGQSVMVDREAIGMKRPSGQLCDASTHLYRDLHRILLSYTLLAASRTFAAGDAFMILNDLYGGEGVVFCPYTHGSVSSCPSTPSRRSCSDVNMGSGSDNSSVASNTSSLLTDHCDCQVAITTSGVKVKLRERYRLFCTAEMNRCVNPKQLPTPLACFECTTTTIIILSSAAQAACVEKGQAGAESFAQLFGALVSDPQDVVHRAITIEPFLP